MAFAPDIAGPERAEERDPSALSLAAAAITGAMIVFAAFGYFASAHASAFETPAFRTGAAAVGGAFAGDYASGGGTLVLSSSGEARAEGDIQHIDVEVSAGRFVPNYIHVRSGVPLVMRFSAGAQSAKGVRIEKLGIAADLSGERTVRLPGLDPGVYPFTSGHGTVSGVIVSD